MLGNVYLYTNLCWWDCSADRWHTLLYKFRLPKRGEIYTPSRTDDRLNPAARPPSTIDIRWVWAGFSTIQDPRGIPLCAIPLCASLAPYKLVPFRPGVRIFNSFCPPFRSKPAVKRWTCMWAAAAGTQTHRHQNVSGKYKTHVGGIEPPVTSRTPLHENIH